MSCVPLPKLSDIKLKTDTYVDLFIILRRLLLKIYLTFCFKMKGKSFSNPEFNINNT